MARTEIRAIALKYFQGWLKEANEIFEEACYNWDSSAIECVKDWTKDMNMEKSDIYEFFLTLV